MKNYYSDCIQFSDQGYTDILSGGLDPYKVYRLIRKVVMRAGRITFTDLLFSLTEEAGTYDVTAGTLRDSLYFLHDNGFGVIFDGKTVRYESECDAA